MHKLLLSFTVFSDIYRSFIRNKTTFTKNTFCLVDFKAPLELWNLLRQAVPGKFRWSGGYSECNSLQWRRQFS